MGRQFRRGLKALAAHRMYSATARMTIALRKINNANLSERVVEEHVDKERN
jgi:hypothetical protein